MAIEIARSNEVPGAVSGSRGRSGSKDGADSAHGASSFASALTSVDREPNAASVSAARVAADREAANRRDADATAGRDAAASDQGRIDARTSDAGARSDSGKDREDAPSTAADTAISVASSTPTASTAAADTSALLLAQSNLTAVSASSALDAGTAAVAAAGATGSATLAAIAGAGAGSAIAAAVPQDALAAQNTTTQRAAAPPVAASGTVKDTGTVDSHSAALGVALLDRTSGKKDGAKDFSRAASTQDASTSRIPTSTAATALAVTTADAAAASRAAVSAIVAPAAETFALAQAAAANIPGEGASPWRRIERPGDTSTPSAGAGSLGFDATGSASLSTATTDAAAAAANAGAGRAEFMERMVDQVSWWMAHRSQGAELKLDLPGGQPVSVSVQVQGNEAQVAFRSDHPEARQWLSAAMPQLKEMLGNEGLMLSGSSVGQSGTGAEQEAARDAQRALRSDNGGSASTGASAIDTSMTTAARPRTVSERAIDLYV